MLKQRRDELISSKFNTMHANKTPECFMHLVEEETRQVHLENLTMQEPLVFLKCF